MATTSYNWIELKNAGCGNFICRNTMQCVQKQTDNYIFKHISEICLFCMRVQEITGHKVQFNSLVLPELAIKKNNLVSWHLCTWVHFLARHEIRTNNYILLQFHFPKETNTRGSKAPTPFTPFHTNLQFWLIKRIFRTITLRISCYDFKTTLICWEIWKLMLSNVSIAHIQRHIYGFS